MIEERVTDIDLGNDYLLDIDVLDDDSYIAITSQGRVVFPYHSINLHERYKFPIIRQLTSDYFLVVNGRTEVNKDNCIIYDMAGHVFFNILCR